MTELILLSLVVVFGAVVVFISIRYGESNAEKKHAQKDSEEMAKDAEVAASPDVPNPLSDIRRMSGQD